jgi:ATP-dependent Lhr-like helicase
MPDEMPDPASLGANAGTVRDSLRDAGALFFAELVQETGLLAAQVEEALRELVARGFVTADGFLGLRALLVPAQHRKRARRLGRFDIREAGRWSLVRRPKPETRDPEADAEHAARVLLDRYGVVFRRLTERESLPPWRDLLRVYRRLEARGEIRGGRFVNGFSGEQYALPEAVEGLRAVRKRPRDGRLVSVSAADPLNLVGLIVPGDRVPALAGNRVLYRDGEAVAVRVGGADRFLVPLEEGDAWEAKKRLEASDMPPRLRAYLGRRR